MRNKVTFSQSTSLRSWHISIAIINQSINRLSQHLLSSCQILTTYFFGLTVVSTTSGGAKAALNDRFDFLLVLYTNHGTRTQRLW